MTSRAAVRADAVFEAVLGVGLLAGAATSTLDASDFPDGVGRVVIAITGALLVVLALLIWSERIGVRTLAGANTLSAVVGLVWLAAGSDFSGAGVAIVVITVVGLLVLATAQVISLQM